MLGNEANLFSTWQDGDFSEQRFRDIVNAYLANSVGNLANRALNLLKKNCSGSLPAGAADIPPDHTMRELTVRQVCLLQQRCAQGCAQLCRPALVR